MSSRSSLQSPIEIIDDDDDDDEVFVNTTRTEISKRNDDGTKSDNNVSKNSNIPAVPSKTTTQLPTTTTTSPKFVKRATGNTVSIAAAAATTTSKISGKERANNSKTNSKSVFSINSRKRKYVYNESDDTEEDELFQNGIEFTQLESPMKESAKRATATATATVSSSNKPIQVQQQTDVDNTRKVNSSNPTPIKVQCKSENPNEEFTDDDEEGKNGSNTIGKIQQPTRQILERITIDTESNKLYQSVYQIIQSIYNNQIQLYDTEKDIQFQKVLFENNIDDDDFDNEHYENYFGGTTSSTVPNAKILSTIDQSQSTITSPSQFSSSKKKREIIIESYNTTTTTNITTNHTIKSSSSVSSSVVGGGGGKGSAVSVSASKTISKRTIPVIDIPYESILKDDTKPLPKSNFCGYLHDNFTVPDETKFQFVPYLDNILNDNGEQVQCNKTEKEIISSCFIDYDLSESKIDIQYTANGSRVVREDITKITKAILYEYFILLYPNDIHTIVKKQYVFYSMEVLFNIPNFFTSVQDHYYEVLNEQQQQKEHGIGVGGIGIGIGGFGIVNRLKVEQQQQQQQSQQQQKYQNATEVETNDKKKNDSNNNDDKENDNDNDTTTNSDSSCIVVDDMNQHLDTYVKAVWTLRNLWCRRCYQFDCNIHDNIAKATLKTQYDINIQRESDSKRCVNQHKVGLKYSFWQDANELFFTMLKDINSSIMMRDSATKPNNSNDVSSSSSSSNPTNNNGDNTDTIETLTTFQKSIIGRVYQIYEGNIERIAKILRTSVQCVQSYVNEYPNDFPVASLKFDTKLIRSSHKSGKLPHYSPKNYRDSWTAAIAKAGLVPYCFPCSHCGVCNEDNCDCINNNSYCTMACTINSDSPNFFRGCNCTSDCNKSSCACYISQRECDPDLCNCSACTEPMYQVKLVKQTCKNDVIYMKRANPTLVGQSVLAGYGLYNKYTLTKGDFIGEYVGEKISQKEAERRGPMNDVMKSSYLFNLASDAVIDAIRKGNKTRYINHSTNGNISVKVMTVRGEQRIGFYAKCNIPAQSELLFDYEYGKKYVNKFIVKAATNTSWMKETGTASTTGTDTNTNTGISTSAGTKKTKKKSTTTSTSKGKKDTKKIKQKNKKKKVDTTKDDQKKSTK